MNLDQLGQILTSLDRFRWIWTGFDDFASLHTISQSNILYKLFEVSEFGPVWNSLDQFGPVWTCLDAFRHVLTRLDAF